MSETILMTLEREIQELKYCLNVLEQHQHQTDEHLLRCAELVDKCAIQFGDVNTALERLGQAVDSLSKQNQTENRKQ